MNINDILNKMGCGPMMRAAIINAPEGLERQFAEAGFRTEQELAEFSLIAGLNQNDLKQFIDLIGTAEEDRIVRLAIPRGSGLIMTDLSKDTLDDLLSPLGKKCGNEVQIDDDWTSFLIV